jgi:hypothetical protein
MITVTMFEVVCVCAGCFGLGSVAGVFLLDAWFRRQLSEARRIALGGME